VPQTSVIISCETEVRVDDFRDDKHPRHLTEYQKDHLTSNSIKDFTFINQKGSNEEQSGHSIEIRRQKPITISGKVPSEESTFVLAYLPAAKTKN
jgi:hypothetical protein